MSEDHTGEHNTTEDNEDEYVFTVDQKNCTTTMEIERLPTDVMIDSGASCNILSVTQWENLKKRGESITKPTEYCLLMEQHSDWRLYTIS